MDRKKTFLLEDFLLEDFSQTPRVASLLKAYGREKFLEEILPTYFSGSEIGKIYKKKLPGWEVKLENRLNEASEIFYKKEQYSV